jgi:hypothetical protein
MTVVRLKFNMQLRALRQHLGHYWVILQKDARRRGQALKAP